MPTMTTRLLLTQAAIDAAVDADTMHLYNALHEAGALPEVQSQGTFDAFAAAGSAMFAATAHDRTLRHLALVWESASGDLACGSFEEGFERGVAFLRCLATLEQPPRHTALAPSLAHAA
jgi:hypothetical protein